MEHLTPRRFPGWLALAILPALFTGCASNPQSVENRAEALTDNSNAAVVIGKLQIIRNGQEVHLQDGILNSNAKLHLTDVAHGRTIRAAVGTDGNFAWALHPELYQVSAIEFTTSGRQVIFPTSLTFAASPDQDATYIGTISLRTNIDSGYYGLNATAESMRVLNECEHVCNNQLSTLGINRDQVDIRLVRPGVAMVSASAQ